MSSALPSSPPPGSRRAQNENGAESLSSFHRRIIVAMEIRQFVETQQIRASDSPSSSVTGWSYYQDWIASNPQQHDFYKKYGAAVLTSNTLRRSYCIGRVLRPYIRKSAHCTIDVDDRAWEIFKSYPFPTYLVRMEHMRGSSSVSRPKPPILETSTRFELLLHLICLGRIYCPTRYYRSTKDFHMERRRRYPLFCRTQSARRIVFAVQSIVRAWDDVAQTFEFDSIESLSAPYIVFNRKKMRFTALSQREGYADRTQSSTILCCEAPGQNPTNEYEHVTTRPTGKHSVLRQLSIAFLSDLVIYVETNSLFSAKVADWSGHCQFLSSSTVTTFMRRFDTLQLELQEMQTYFGGNFLRAVVEKDAHIDIDSDSNDPSRLEGISTTAPEGIRPFKRCRVADHMQGNERVKVEQVLRNTAKREANAADVDVIVLDDDDVDNDDSDDDDNSDDNDDGDDDSSNDDDNDSDMEICEVGSDANNEVEEVEDGDEDDDHLDIRTWIEKSCGKGAEQMAAREEEKNIVVVDDALAIERKPKEIEEKCDEGDDEIEQVMETPAKRHSSSNTYSSLIVERASASASRPKQEGRKGLSHSELWPARHSGIVDRGEKGEADPVSYSVEGKGGKRWHSVVHEVPKEMPVITGVPRFLMDFLLQRWRCVTKWRDAVDYPTLFWPKELVDKMANVDDALLIDLECAGTKLYIADSKIVVGREGVFANKVFQAEDVICHLHGSIMYECRQDGEERKWLMGKRGGVYRSEGVRVEIPLPSERIKRWNLGQGWMLQRVWVVGSRACLAAKVVNGVCAEGDSMERRFLKRRGTNAKVVVNNGKDGVSKRTHVCEVEAVKLVAVRDIEKDEELCARFSEGTSDAVELVDSSEEGW